MTSGLTPPAWAGSFGVETKLTASDAAAFDRFGFSVAVSGNTAIVGAEDNDDSGFGSGAAYLFEVSTGRELLKLTATDGATSDSFGRSVAISGNTAIVGAYRDGSRDEGSAYLFDVSMGAQLFKLTAGSSAGEFHNFGETVAISGNIAIVGEPVGDGRRSGTGAAYLFDATTGQLLHKLFASDGGLLDRFGQSVAISGSTAIVGAYLTDHGAGAAYLFDVSTGQQLFKLSALDAAAGDNFGLGVGISGNTAIVGASSKADDHGGRFSGEAYLFDVSAGTELFKLTDAETTAGDYFGISVAISGDTAIVGAFGDADAGTQSGSAYLFDATNGGQIAKLTASDAEEGNFFGRSVAISDSTAIVGAYKDMDAGGELSGSAYLFTPEPSSLELVASLVGLLGSIATNRRR